jgi:signal transduction histidine kinase
VTHPGSKDKSKHFSDLTRKENELAPRSWEEFDRLLADRERANHRLKHLFEISKLLSEFKTVETSIPEIIGVASGTLPILTAVLIEYRDGIPRTVVFHAAELSELRLREVLTQARNSCRMLLGLSLSQMAELESHPATAFPFSHAYASPAPEIFDRKNSITLPMIVYELPPFGTFQIECTCAPDEVDLAFIGSLSNLIAVALDRRQVAQHEQDLRRREIEARKHELNRSKGKVSDLEQERDFRNRFMATLTHDLRTPLTSVGLSAQLIVKDPTKVEQNKILATNIKRSIDRADTMIQDLLDMARIRSGEHLPLKIVECDLQEIVTSCIGEMSVQYGDRFRLDIRKQDENRGFWSADLLRRIIENLINNAVKYGLPGHPITISLRQVGEEEEISVHNEGNPLSAEEQKDIFNPFSRTHSANASEKKGWGLGLTLVRGAAESHGGSVRVESSREKGTCFIVKLPRDARPLESRA